MAFSGHMMRLGSYTFEIGTAAYQKFQRTDSYRWVTQERLANDPAEQFVGWGGTKIELEGVIFPAYNRGAGIPGALTGPVGTYQIEGMRALADSGDPAMLVDGRGNVFGEFAVISIREDAETFLDNGAPRKQTFSISLRSYDNDSDNGGGWLFGGLGGIAAIASAVTGGASDAFFDGIDAGFQALAAIDYFAADIATLVLGGGFGSDDAYAIGVRTSSIRDDVGDVVSPYCKDIAKLLALNYNLGPVPYVWSFQVFNDAMDTDGWQDAGSCIRSGFPTFNKCLANLGVFDAEAAQSAIALLATSDGKGSDDRGLWMQAVAAALNAVLDSRADSLGVNLGSIMGAPVVNRMGLLVQALAQGKRDRPDDFADHLPEVEINSLLDAYGQWNDNRMVVAQNIPVRVAPTSLPL